MNLSRNDFIAQFSVTIRVQCLKFWSKRRKEPPYDLSTCIHEWISTARGILPTDRAGFSETLRPVIEELHRTTPQGKAPDPDDVLGRVYDALDAAGVEVTLRPTMRGHG